MSSADLSPDTARVVAQIGRVPRAPWRVEVRCSYGAPSVIATAPVLEDGSPFPTLYWLTCPFLLDVAARAESEGHVSAWADRLAEDHVLADRMRAADREYRSRRAAEPGRDPSSGVGIAGQRDPLATKCLHAHIAAALAGIDDPIGTALTDQAGRECADFRCRLLELVDSQ
jgi:hypothetical protein